jgi:hypothetical protein
MSGKSDSEEQREVAAALRAAEDELQAALAIALDRRCRGEQSSLHIVRAWQAIATAARNGVPGPSREAGLVARLDPRDLDHIREPERREWERSLRAMEEAASRERSVPAEPAGPGRGELLRHCRWLEQALRKARRRLGVRLQASRSRRSASFWIVSAMLLAAAGLFSIGDRAAGRWRAAYYPNIDLMGAALSREDRDVFFDWGDEPPLPSLPRDDFSAAWETCLHVERHVRSRFLLGSDDGSRLLVDGKLIVDDWGTHDFQIASAELPLEAGSHLLRVEFFDKAGAARVALRAAFDSGPLAPLPAERLSLPEVSGNGATQCRAP